MAGYDDRDGKIWMDGTLVDWRDAKVHVLTHALHYASSVFEGERCYNGKIFKGHEHSERLRTSGELLDMPLPFTADQIDAAKEFVTTDVSKKTITLPPLFIVDMTKMEITKQGKLRAIGSNTFADGVSVDKTGANGDGYIVSAITNKELPSVNP